MSLQQTFYGSAIPVVNQTNTNTASLFPAIGGGGGGGGGPVVTSQVITSSIVGSGTPSTVVNIGATGSINLFAPLTTINSYNGTGGVLTVSSINCSTINGAAPGGGGGGNQSTISQFFTSSISDDGSTGFINLFGKNGIALDTQGSLGQVVFNSQITGGKTVVSTVTANAVTVSSITGALDTLNITNNSNIVLQTNSTVNINTPSLELNGLPVYPGAAATNAPILVTWYYNSTPVSAVSAYPTLQQLGNKGFGVPSTGTLFVQGSCTGVGTTGNPSTWYLGANISDGVTNSNIGFNATNTSLTGLANLSFVGGCPLSNGVSYTLTLLGAINSVTGGEAFSNIAWNVMFYPGQ